jgi:CheY-like chemotaxis protein
MFAREPSREVPLILLIENDPEDIFLFRRALARAHYGGEVRVVGSAREARAYLEGERPFHDRDYFRRPHLIVSDMSVHRETGHAFLAWLQQDARFRDVPLVFFAGAYTPTDRERTAPLGAKKFLEKTGDISLMTERIQELLAFLPPEIPPTA